MKNALGFAAGFLFTALALVPFSAEAAEEVNLYSSRHYETDEKLYTDFEEATGIKVNRIEGKADELIARLKAEGENSPADVLITVDASRAWRAQSAGLLQPIESDLLTARIPAAYRSTDGSWFGFSLRARIIFFSKETVTSPPLTYQDLTDPKYRGQVCMRSSESTYSQTLLASIIEHDGEEAAHAWVRGLKANLARDPQGGDTDQLRAILSGECQIAIANTYYFARALRRPVSGLSEGIEKIGWVFPGQQGRGAHVNISVAGVAKHAPNRANAIKFLEYLAGDQAQSYFSSGNDEYPAVKSAPISESVQSLGSYQADPADLARIAEHIPLAQQIYDEEGYK